jgi:transcriptional regulator with XRE-family HTH domain
VAIGALIRELRQARGWSQDDLAAKIRDVSMRATKTREDVSRYENEKVIPGPTTRRHLAIAFDIPEAVFTEEARLSRVNRRAFLSLAALSAAHGKIAAETIAAVSSGDPALLTAGQTTHGTDLVIASLVDIPAARHLRRWMADADDPVLRVNAAGILAKLPDQDPAREVAATLAADDTTRQLYSTAVLARVCSLEWRQAGQIASEPTALPAATANRVARRLIGEVRNQRDAGARWCAATMLRDLSPVLH